MLFEEGYSCLPVQKLEVELVVLIRCVWWEYLHDLWPEMQFLECLQPPLLGLLGKLLAQYTSESVPETASSMFRPALLVVPLAF